MWQTLKDAIDNAMPDPVELYDWLHTADEIVEAVGPVLAAVAAGGAGVITEGLAGLLEDAAAGVALPVAATVTGGAALFLAELAPLGLAYAGAKSDVEKDQSARGFSLGVVMGVYKASPDFLKSHFLKWSPDPNPVMPELEAPAQHYYNAGLALGYHYGYELNQKEAEVFWKDLARTGVDLDEQDPKSSQDWHDWVDFYITAAVQFRKLHIED